MTHFSESPQAKVLSREQFIDRFARPRRRRIVFTNGCFDLLHRGHVEYLAEAGTLGDRLIIGLNSDASVRRLKGESRPIVPAKDRAVVLAALEFVDAVTIFGEDTPLELIRAVLPDVLVKGGDYTPDEVVGAEPVRAAGGAVVIIPFRPGYSTSELIERMRRP